MNIFSPKEIRESVLLDLKEKTELLARAISGNEEGIDTVGQLGLVKIMVEILISISSLEIQKKELTEINALERQGKEHIIDALPETIENAVSRLKILVENVLKGTTGNSINLSCCVFLQDVEGIIEEEEKK